MSYLKTGNLVLIKNVKKSGMLLYECKEPKDTWCLLVKEGLDGEINIKQEDVKNLKEYRNKCWNCGSPLNSIDNNTCQFCHWLKCDNCGKCRLDTCVNDKVALEVDGVIIRKL